MNPVAQFFRWWRARCARNWAVVVSIAAGIVAIYGVSPIIAEWRFWSWRWETGLLASRLYPPTLADQQRLTLSLENRLEWLNTRAKANKLEPHQWGEIAVTQDAIKQSKREEEKIIREEAFFRGKLEYR